MATVVAKLFALAGRCRAYFGEKDFQQLAVVRRLTADLSLPVEVVGCPTVREHDGLALVEPQRPDVGRRAPRRPGAAPCAWWPVSTRCCVRRASPRSVVIAAMTAEFDGGAVGGARLRRRRRRRHASRRPPALSGEVRLLVAATVGPVRLIDNEGAVAGARRGRPRRAARRRSSRPKLTIPSDAALDAAGDDHRTGSHRERR